MLGKDAAKLLQISFVFFLLSSLSRFIKVIKEIIIVKKKIRQNLLLSLDFGGLSPAITALSPCFLEK
jgi:hypothetical protein